MKSDMTQTEIQSAYRAALFGKRLVIELCITGKRILER